MQKARRHPKAPTACRADGFRYYFTPLFRVLFTFPSRYLFTIGLSVVFSLTRWFWQIHTGFHMSRATQDTERHTPTYIRGYHPILLTFPGLFCRSLLDLFLSYNPNLAETRLVWAVPRSLAATWGIINYFLFLRLLRCFSSPG